MEGHSSDAKRKRENYFDLVEVDLNKRSKREQEQGKRPIDKLEQLFWGAPVELKDMVFADVS
jgi:hypothetical protein